jgi:hypothetical protein
MLICMAIQTNIVLDFLIYELHTRPWFVHHLVKFLTLKNFHRPFPILIEQMMC